MLYTLIFMMVIGAVIGGVTNHLAIKMLFRPYQAIYIGKWRVPFTPGIIPRRRDEMSVQLGDMVVKHLLTSDSIQKKLEEDEFKQKITEWSKQEVAKLLKSQVTAREILAKHLHIDCPEETINTKTVQFIEKVYQRFCDSHGQKSLQEIMPLETHKAIKGKIPFLAEQIIQRAIEYLASEDADGKIQIIVNQILEEKKMIKSIVGLFVKNDNMVEKVKAELIKILRKETTTETIIQILDKEWYKITSKDLNTYFEYATPQTVSGFVESKLLSYVPIEHWLDKSVEEWATPYQEKIIQEFLPKTLDKAGQVAVAKVDDVLIQFDLSNIVRTQVESFPVERLEELILGIVNKEFRMITYLGALLGGLIGIFQAVVVQLM